MRKTGGRRNLYLGHACAIVHVIFQDLPSRLNILVEVKPAHDFIFGLSRAFGLRIEAFQQKGFSDKNI